MEVAATAHGAELRRCLIQVDVSAFTALRKHIAPHFDDLSPARAMIAIHMARVEMKYIPKKLKQYSIDWLADKGIQKIEGVWTEGLPKPIVFADSVGIAVKSRDPRHGRRVYRAMDDALQNSRAKGVTDPLIQREAMLKAREKVRFKARLA